MNLAFVIFVLGLVVNVSAVNFISSNAHNDASAGRIIAQSGKNLSIYCEMDLKDFLGYNSSNLNLYFDNNKTLKDVFSSFKKETLNETTLAVHIHDPPEMYMELQCMAALNESDRSNERGVDVTGISIGHPPTKVNNFKCRTYNWERMVCTFTAPNNYVFPNYKLLYGHTKYDVTTVVENRDVKNNTNYTYTLSYETADYSPGHELYYFKLAANNALGQLNQGFMVNNYRACITDPPEKLLISHLGEYGAQINWQVPSIMRRFRTNITHKIMYSFNNSSFMEYMKFSSHENDNNMFVLKLPHANTWYDVQVHIKVTAAPNTDEFWRHSNTIFSTLPDRPSKPPAITSGSFYRKEDSNDLIIYWKEVENIYKNGNGYNVSILDKDGNNVKMIYMTNTMATIPYVDDMTYKLYSENVIGKLETYSEIYVPSNQLPKITDIKKIIVGNTFELSWSYTVPNNFNEDIENFTVFWCIAKSAASDECATSIDFKVLDKSTMYFTYPSLLNTQQYNFAVAVNTKSTSSGMAWAKCTADPNTSIGKLNSFYISSVSSNFIVVQWRLDCVYETIATGFNIKYCKLRDPKDASCDGDAMIHSIPGNATEYRIGNLVPYTSYSISMQLFSNNRSGLFSDPKVNTTLESEPSVPRNLRYSNLTYNSTNLEWDAPLNKNGRLDHFEIWYKANNDPAEHRQIRIEESSSLSYILNNLNSYTTYEIWLTACTHYCSNSSNLITVRTEIGPPMKVLDFISERGQPNSQILSWRQAKPTGPHEIYDVIVRASVKDKKFEYIASTLKGTQCTIKIDSICNQEDISYDFYVKPKNIIYNDWNEYLDYKTATTTTNPVDISNESHSQISVNNSNKNMDINDTTTTADSNKNRDKMIEKRHTLIDTNSNNRFNTLDNQKSIQQLNNNDDVSINENRIYCLEALHDTSNFNVIYVGESVVFPKLIVCTGPAVHSGQPTWLIVLFGLLVGLFVVVFAIYKKIRIMSDFKIDLPDGLKDLKMEKPITNFIDLNNYAANKSPYAIAKDREERLNVYIDEQEQCLLKQRLESISSNSNNSGDNHYVCNEAIDNSHSIDHLPMDNKIEAVIEDDDSDKSTVSTYKIPMQVFSPMTPPTTIRNIPSISQEHLLESHNNTVSNIDLTVMDEGLKKYIKEEEENEKMETPISQLRNVHKPIFKPLSNVPQSPTSGVAKQQSESGGYIAWSHFEPPKTVFNGYLPIEAVEINEVVPVKPAVAVKPDITFKPVVTVKPVVADKPVVAVQSAVVDNHDFAVQPPVTTNVDDPTCTQTSTPYTTIDKLSPVCSRGSIKQKLEEQKSMMNIGQPPGPSGLIGYVTRNQLRTIELARQDANDN